MAGGMVRDGAAAGYLLGEALHEAERKGRGRASLAGDLARRVAEAAAALEALDHAERVAKLGGAAQALRAIPAAPQAERRLPPRALALLAPATARDVGARWLAELSPHRPGFRPRSDLVEYLRRLAASEPAPAPEEPWPA